MRCGICLEKQAVWETYGGNLKVCDRCLKLYAPEDLVKPKRIRRLKK